MAVCSKRDFCYGRGEVGEVLQVILMYHPKLAVFCAVMVTNQK